MRGFTKGRYRVRLADGAGDLLAAQRLRYSAFRDGGRGGEGVDSDPHDQRCTHVLVEDGETGSLLATCRLGLIPTGRDLAPSYSAQFYDLAPMAGLSGQFLEVGRFCLAPGLTAAADVLRLAWAALTRIVDEQGVTVMFGCSSFAGCDPAPYRDAFAHLAERYVGPAHLRPGPRAGETVPMALRAYDLRAALAQLPPLLRTYLAMGGWVSDHAVVDRDLGTLHVFTAVEIAQIPQSRARLLRADAS